MTNKEELLLMKREQGYDSVTQSQKKKIFDFSEGYKEFIGRAKTERVFVKDTIELLKKEGFKKFSPDIKRGE